MRLLVLSYAIFFAATALATGTEDTWGPTNTWVRGKFGPNCASFTDVIHQQITNSYGGFSGSSREQLLNIRRLSANECKVNPATGKINDSECVLAFDRLIGNSPSRGGKTWTERAIEEGGCEISSAFESLTNPGGNRSSNAASTVCTTPRTGLEFSKQTGSNRCKITLDCSERGEFTFAGNTFSPGRYEFSCQADADGSCTSSSIANNTCPNGTSQKLGRIWNDSVVPMSSSRGAN